MEQSEQQLRNDYLESRVRELELKNAELAHGVSDDEIDLRELWQALWQGKWIIVGLTSIFAVASVFYALSLPNMYKATALLAPASQTDSGSLSNIAGQFGGLASLAGINLGGGESSKDLIAQEIIKSWGFIETFIEKQNIAAEVFAVKGWHLLSNQLIYDETLYNNETKTWLREPQPSVGRNEKPSSGELYEKFKEYLSLNQDKKTGLISLSIEYYSPIKASQWVEAIIQSINQYMKEQDVKEAQKNIEYLKQQITQTAIADMQSIFYQLIEEQTKTLMLANASDEYVLKTLNAAKIPEEKSKPKRALICVAGTFLGGFISVVVVFISFLLRESKFK